MTDLATTAAALPIAPPRLTVFDTGSECGPQGQAPGEAVFSVEEAKHALNPLQHLPLVGMLYRQATGETVPPPLSILGSVATGAMFGGPIGILGAVAVNFLQELFRLGPDTSRPPVPEGMSVTGSEAGVTPVTPGTVSQPGGYTTLATVLPDFLGGGTQFAGTDPSTGQVRQAIEAYSAVSAMGSG